LVREDFSLVEILVVVAMIAVLAGLSLTALSGGRKESAGFNGGG